MKENLYKIQNFKNIDPFLMSITSSDNHWMYLSSSGCLSAGRQKAEFALFPYVTDDLLHKNSHFTGPVSCIFVYKDNDRYFWQPFSNQIDSYKKEQNLYKNSLGNKIVFEEINYNLGLTFLYSWQASDQYGFIKKTKLINHGENELNIKLIDGLRNILPAGIELRTQQEMSNLANAYKVSECNPDYNYTLYYMNALLMDKPDPGESLYSNIVWSYSKEHIELSVNEKAISNFLINNNFKKDYLLKGKEGSFLNYIEKILSPDDEICWYIIADVQKSQLDISNIIMDLKDYSTIGKKLEKSVEANYDAFEKYIGMADGYQCTSLDINDLHHTANVTYNVLRGGICYDNYNIQKNSFLAFLKNRNKKIAEKYIYDLDKLPSIISIKDLKFFGDKTDDPSLKRLCREYLPLTLGRRHGDPSRPWNHFNILTKDENNKPFLYFEGNWRDIFQNWEALGLSYPECLESMVSIFLNATSTDGYNPYRLTTNGIDWEIIEPDDSWSHIGYWNDHQIIYLLKLLEHLGNYRPKILEQLFSKSIFSYSNIPYRIKNFNDIVKNPKETIDFDYTAHKNIIELVNELGSDGKLVLTNQKNVYHVNLCEKLLVLSLAKICNYVPVAGIWLNTQRPEWNDANNALVGNGTSMVTVYYLKRFLEYFNKMIEQVKIKEIEISYEVFWWFSEVEKTIIKNKDINHAHFSDKDRMKYVSTLGNIFENYRTKTYSKGFSSCKKLNLKKIGNFLSVINNHFKESILSNRSEKGLFQAYNTIDINLQNQTIDIKNLSLMLEGQVAGLSCKTSNPSDSVSTLKSLFSSDLYRSDMKSFILYPEQAVTPFLKKNIIKPKYIKKGGLLQTIIDHKITNIIERDIDGNFRFSPEFRNSFDLLKALKKLPESLKKILAFEKELEKILKIFELVFNHRNFTGRSGTMFSYEGIGSIYWHMISKLLLATQENYFLVKNSNSPDKKIIKNLGKYYYKIRNGLSAAKTPKEYGAFPFDPYSHTPSHSGAQQPGMTGQVKEEILTRFGELGCFVRDGCLIFDTSLLLKEEFLIEKRIFTYFDILKKKLSLEIRKGQLAYTFCQVPILYNLSNKDTKLKLTLNDSSKFQIKSNKIDKEMSRSIFNREGLIKIIEFDVNEKFLFML